MINSRTPRLLRADDGVGDVLAAPDVHGHATLGARLRHAGRLHRVP